MKKNYTINVSIPVDTFWRVVVPATAATIVLGILFAVFIVDRFIMPNVVGVERDLVTTPPVAGLTVEDGRDKILSVGLRCEVKSREYNDQVPAGYIIGQYPASGEQVKKGRLIDIIISNGCKSTAVPSVRGMNDRQARIELRKRDIDIARIRLAFNDTVPKDRAIGTEPEAGLVISKEMTVDLIMSKGPKPTSAEVPNLVGESIEDARTRIEEAGLTLGKTGYAGNPTVQPGTVVSQSLSPGSNVPLESPVDIIVAVQKK